LIETFNKSKYKDSIIFTGYLKDEDLIALYQQALAFIYPSLYEGFGLPVLEAMACGVPVITSNNSSLAEIANDSALCCDPYSIDEIAQSMQKISESQALRNELAAAGIKKANEFSWEKTAKETAKVLLSCLN
jgi:glycosyltransferase involved in cell wall biosynthesis